MLKLTHAIHDQLISKHAVHQHFNDRFVNPTFTFKKRRAGPYSLLVTFFLNKSPRCDFLKNRAFSKLAIREVDRRQSGILLVLL